MIFLTKTYQWYECYVKKIYYYGQKDKGFVNFDILLTVHLNIFILILTNLMH